MVPRDNPLDMDADRYGVAVAKPSKKEARTKEALAKKETLEKQAADLLFKNELIVDAERALYEEYKALCHGPDRPQSDGSPEREKQLTAWLAKHPKYALCLSGGGIRSAAFCMGALRALALSKMLPQFHYLSTVSGGGYIGGWLQHLIILKNYSVEDAAEVLASSQALPEVKNLRDFTNFLAPTPGLLSADALSGGVLYMRNLIVNWMMFLPALVALSLVPGLYRDILCAIAADGQTPPRSGEPVLVAALLFVIGLGALAWSVFHACLFVPSHSHDIDADTRKPIQNDPGAEQAATKKSRPKELGSGTTQINRNVVLPALLWALLVPLCFAAWSPPPEAIRLPVDEEVGYHLHRGAGLLGLTDPQWLLVVGPAIAAAVVMFVTYLIAWWRVVDHFSASTTARQRDLHRSVFRRNWPIWLAGCVISGAMIGAVLAAGLQARAEEIAAFGPLLILTAHVLQTTFYVALRRDPPRADLDREWLARLNAQHLFHGALFAAWAACSLILPQWLLTQSGGVPTVPAIVGVATGPAAALMARRAASLLKKRDGLAASLGVRLFDVATLFAALVFAASLTAVFSRSAESLILSFCDIIWGEGDKTSWLACFAMTAAATLILGGLSYLLGYRININRFSMHSVYRNRLVRAFLGSARSPDLRQPDTFTRFDAKDNPRLSEFAPRRFADQEQLQSLFPVIGVTLNLVGGSRTAWSERKSAPFTITPLRCGAAELNHTQIAAALDSLEQGKRMTFGARPVKGGWTERQPSGAYARTETYAGEERTLGVVDESRAGITLGTAMALSGAAVSSSMGSRSSSAYAFLLTLFDLRLGMWLPNPARVQLPPAALEPSHGLLSRVARRSESDWQAPAAEQARASAGDAALDQLRPHLNSPKPLNTLKSLFQEMFSKVDDQGEALYLSDGGHFDNLGLYEMLRRRCKCILVIDVGSDPDYSFTDLGAAIRRANIDLDACVEFDPVPCPGQSKLARCGLYATIRYPARPNLDLEETSGELLIIKPWLPDDTPAEVRVYHAGNPSFPHDSTANQFFTESQFESYRRLGEHVTAGVLGHATDVEKLFASAKARKGT